MPSEKLQVWKNIHNHYTAELKIMKNIKKAINTSSLQQDWANLWDQDYSQLQNIKVETNHFHGVYMYNDPLVNSLFNYEN